MKRYIENLIRKCGYDIKKIRRNPKKKIRQYLAAGRVPWKNGYSEYKEDYIYQQINNKNIMNSFKTREALPTGYGRGLDERCVEYPWLFSHLDNNENIILDAGSVLNYCYLLESAQLKKRNITIMTLQPEHQCFWEKSVSYHFGDLMNTPFKDEYFDEIVCLSTIEHVGMNNEIYTGKDQSDSIDTKSYLTALTELKRILKHGGKLYLSVPFGKYVNFQSFQQFDIHMIEATINAFLPEHYKLDIYSYNRGGWGVSEASACRDLMYSEYALDLMQGRSDAKPDKDNVAAARAVACLLMTKG